MNTIKNKNKQSKQNTLKRKQRAKTNNKQACNNKTTKQQQTQTSK